MKVAANLVAGSKSSQVSALARNACAIHLSSLQSNNQSDVVNESFSVYSVQPSTTKRSYRDQVILIGDVAAEPLPVYRNGNLSSFKLKIMTLAKHRSKNGGVVKEISSYHEANCSAKRYFSIIENSLNVNDQVVIHGSLVNTITHNLDEVIYRSVINVTDLHVISQT